MNAQGMSVAFPIISEVHKIAQTDETGCDGGGYGNVIKNVPQDSCGSSCNIGRALS